MNHASWLGLGLTAVGVLGYGLGLTVAYAGRAFSVTLVMVGVSLLAMRRVFEAGVERS